MAISVLKIVRIIVVITLIFLFGMLLKRRGGTKKGLKKLLLVAILILLINPITLIIGGIVLISLFSNNNDNNLSAEQFEEYLEGTYGQEFSLIKTEETGDDTVYYFSCGNGIECRAGKRFQRQMFGHIYDAWEDYQLQCVYADPQTADYLKNSQFEVALQDNQSEVFAYFYVDSFEDISPCAAFMYSAVNSYEPVPTQSYAMDNDIKVKSVSLALGMKFTKNPQDNYNFAYYPDNLNNEYNRYKTADELAETFENDYAMQIKYHQIRELLPEDAYEKYLPDYVRVYSEGEFIAVLGTDNNSQFFTEEEFISTEEFQSYPCQLAEIVKAGGWEESFTDNSIIWTKDENTVKIFVEETNGYGISLNKNSLYNGNMISQKGVHFEQSDYQNYFGISFEIDDNSKSAKIVNSQ